MKENPNQPRKYDAVLGGKKIPKNAAVLGGIEGVKMRLGADNELVRAAAIQDALKYGEAGLDLAIAHFSDKSPLVKQTIINLLEQKQSHPKVKAFIESTAKSTHQGASYCLNPNCPNPNNSANASRPICIQCGSEILLQGRYRVIKTLKRSKFSQTYEILDQKDKRYKVLKVLLKSHPKTIELFQQEAQVLSGLKHPGIPAVEPDGYFTFYLKDSNEPLHCLVMEYIEGSNLQDWMKSRRHKPISEEEAVDWLKQLAEILGQVHQQNYLHRDIKPQNIMRKPNGQLVLINFRTVHEVSETYMIKVEGVQSFTNIISPGFTPYEQINGWAVPQSDFFSLGRTFVYLLTGKPPTAFPENPRSGKLHWHRSASHVSSKVANIVDYLMAPFPGNRPQNTEEILQCLNEL